MTQTLCLLLGDQLSDTNAALTHCNKDHDTILLCEVFEEAHYVKHHQKKIAFIFSAMRHFAQHLREQGYNVIYSYLDDTENTGSLEGELKCFIRVLKPSAIAVTFPGEYRVLSMFLSWQNTLSIPVTIYENKHFLTQATDFSEWAEGRKQLRMEYFYREVRKRYAILMDGSKPEGGKWNYDAQNRKALPKDVSVPQPSVFTPDKITEDVLQLVDIHFGDHFGELRPFHYAVTRAQALQVFDDFIAQRLCLFGDYQDAMKQGEPWMFHSHISFYLNIGLLEPLEVAQRAEAEYYAGNASLNAVEGFIRQIIGWREYVRGLYWHKMPGYKDENFFNASHPLPNFYWTADTKMNCLKQCVNETKNNAYAHHIQRLMVLGNFALLTGIDPKQVNEWYLLVYADAYEWVELPNVSGMVLYADGGLLASKPYISGGSYIDKMSDYCKACEYKVRQKNGADACPFNYLYWDFLQRHRAKLGTNPRLQMPYRTLSKMSEEKQSLIASDAQQFIQQLRGD